MSDALASAAAGEADPIFSAGHLRMRRCRHGVMLYSVNDIFLGRMLDLYGELSEGEVALFAQILAPGAVALDIGAHVGAHTLAMSRLVGSAGRVIAFEPQRAIFQMLAANLALNAIRNVDARHAACGAAPGTIAVPRTDIGAEGNFGGVSMGGGEDRVPLATIDGLDLPRCDLIKIDVEGMEAQVLAGGRATIARLQPVLYLENDREDKSSALLRLLSELGYRCFAHTPPYVGPGNFRGRPVDMFANLVSMNLLCVPAARASQVVGMTPVEPPAGG